MIVIVPMGGGMGPGGTGVAVRSRCPRSWMDEVDHFEMETS